MTSEYHCTDLVTVQRFLQLAPDTGAAHGHAHDGVADDGQRPAPAPAPAARHGRHPRTQPPLLALAQLHHAARALAGLGVGHLDSCVLAAVVKLLDLDV